MYLWTTVLSARAPQQHAGLRCGSPAGALTCCATAGLRKRRKRQCWHLPPSVQEAGAEGSWVQKPAWTPGESEPQGHSSGEQAYSSTQLCKSSHHPCEVALSEQPQDLVYENS